MKKIAVILPCFNASNFIDEQVESIVNQRNVDLHLYISDDASSDDTIEKLSKLNKKYKTRITILKNKKKFGNAGKHFYFLIKNISIKKYDFLALSDHDDIWHKDKLSRSIQKMNGYYDGYSSSFCTFYSNHKKKYVNKAFPQKRFDYFFESPGPGSTFLLSKELVEGFKKLLDKPEINKFFYHDWLIYAFARSNRYRWFIDPWPSLLYRQHNRNVSGANIGIKANLRRIKQIRSGWWFYQIHLLCSILNNKDSVSFKKNYLEHNFRRLRLLSIANFCRRKFVHVLFFVFMLSFARIN